MSQWQNKSCSSSRLVLDVFGEMPASWAFLDSASVLLFCCAEWSALNSVGGIRVALSLLTIRKKVGPADLRSAESALVGSDGKLE